MLSLPDGAVLRGRRRRVSREGRSGGARETGPTSEAGGRANISPDSASQSSDLDERRCHRQCSMCREGRLRGPDRVRPTVLPVSRMRWGPRNPASPRQLVAPVLVHVRALRRPGPAEVSSDPACEGCRGLENGPEVRGGVAQKFDWMRPQRPRTWTRIGAAGASRRVRAGSCGPEQIRSTGVFLIRSRPRDPAPPRRLHRLSSRARPSPAGRSGGAPFADFGPFSRTSFEAMRRRSRNVRAWASPAPDVRLYPSFVRSHAVRFLGGPLRTSSECFPTSCVDPNYRLNRTLPPQPLRSVGDPARWLSARWSSSSRSSATAGSRCGPWPAGRESASTRCTRRAARGSPSVASGRRQNGHVFAPSRMSEIPNFWISGRESQKFAVSELLRRGSPGEFPRNSAVAHSIWKDVSAHRGFLISGARDSQRTPLRNPDPEVRYLNALVLGLVNRIISEFLRRVNMRNKACGALLCRQVPRRTDGRSWSGLDGRRQGLVSSVSVLRHLGAYWRWAVRPPELEALPLGVWGLRCVAGATYVCRLDGPGRGEKRAPHARGRDVGAQLVRGCREVPRLCGICGLAGLGRRLGCAPGWRRWGVLSRARGRRSLRCDTHA